MVDMINDPCAVPDLRAFFTLRFDLVVLQLQSKPGWIMPPMHEMHGFLHDFVIVSKDLTATCRFRAPTRRDLQLQHRL